jgi:hypothetical protein
MRLRRAAAFTLHAEVLLESAGNRNNTPMKKVWLEKYSYALA